MKLSLLAFAATLLRPLAVAYFALIKLVRPVQHKIVFISRQSDSTPVDFSLLAAELQGQDRSLKFKYLCCSEMTRSSRPLGNLRQTTLELWHIASARAVILDGYCLAISYFPQRKNLFVLQMWHTLAVMKRISWQAVDTPGGRDGRIAHAFRMHANYSALLTSGQASVENFRHAFRTARARIHVMPLPRVDILRAPDMNRLDMLITAHSDFFTHTPLILYAPTFHDEEESYLQWMENLHVLTAEAEKQGATLIVKTHIRESAALEKSGLSDIQSPNLIINPEIDTLDLLAIVDHVVTDYSGIAFEAAAAGKPVWFYLPDYESYCSKRGLNIDVTRELSDACFADPVELMDALRHTTLPSAEQMQFLNKYVAPPQKVGVSSAKEIARLVLKGIQ